MKKFAVIVTSFLVLITAVPAFAHEIVDNGTASMFVHIQPYETPIIAGIPSQILLEIENSEKGYTIDDSHVVVVIGQNDQALSTVALQRTSDPNVFGLTAVPFTFPAAGKYDITATVTPDTAGTFVPFTVDYDVTVAPAGTKITEANKEGHNHTQHLIHYVLFGIAIALSLFITIREKIRDRKKLKQHENTSILK